MCDSCSSKSGAALSSQLKPKDQTQKNLAGLLFPSLTSSDKPRPSSVGESSKKARQFLILPTPFPATPTAKSIDPGSCRNLWIENRSPGYSELMNLGLGKLATFRSCDRERFDHLIETKPSGLG
ncbi:hypothetical protein L3X38_018367 [Prunus dulcis]|uniref:Uncharacterized protein n=1 Tax=Prunus dulcis TaxID=3755 RepID=A0AAD4W8X3_PRUDU|nr:hypothetical protein L3X38_018367 [Prunus dulcis]